MTSLASGVDSSKSSASEEPGVDPVTLEIVHGSLEATIREMEALIDRTAMSASIKEKKDRFVGLYDRVGNMVGAHVSFSGPGMIRPCCTSTRSTTSNRVTCTCSTTHTSPTAPFSTSATCAS